MAHLSLTGRRWRLAPPPAAPGPAGLHPVAATCLAQRVPAAQAGAWLQPALDHLHPPGAMAGMEVAAERIRRAVRDGERVRIVTDYDVDGTTSSLILQSTLKLLGARGPVDYHIPDRFDEGYGFSPAAARKAVQDGVGLVITADIGVRDHEAVTLAAEGGTDVIVCDHHLPPGESVPDRALAVLCPPQDGCPYPNKALAACGVSLKLAQALLALRPGIDAVVRSMLKIAAIGTVADVVSLATLENRAIVALGLRELATARHAPGLAALLEVAGLAQGPISAADLGFRVGPRINAAGRLDSATAVVDLFQERDPAAARLKAQDLDRLNQDRQRIQEALERRARHALGDADPPAFAVLWGPEPEGWHRGVLGIVAARLRDRIHRPVALVAVDGAHARGSVRSVPAVHAVRALDAAADLLERYGGHPAAAGFSLPADRLPALALRLDAWLRASAGDEALVAELDVDAPCPLREIGWDLVRDLDRLGPFGKDNPAPRLLFAGVEPAGLAAMGNGHLRLRLDGVEAVWWRGAEHAAALAGRLDVAGRLEVNRWQGRESLRVVVDDARHAT